MKIENSHSSRGKCLLSNSVACVLQFKCDDISSEDDSDNRVRSPKFLIAPLMVRRHPAARGVGRSRRRDGCEGKSGGCDTAGSPQR